MKMRMSVGKLPMSGYLNIDPCPKIEKDKIGNFNVKPIDFRAMEFFDTAKNAECTEIILDDCLDYFCINAVKSFLGYICGKLRKYGNIHVSGTDVSEISRAFFNGEISEDEFNVFMYGSGKTIWDWKHGCHSMFKIVDILEGCGIKIDMAAIHEYSFRISGVRE